jgi:hypothetical protein
VKRVKRERGRKRVEREEVDRREESGGEGRDYRDF